MRYYSMLQGHHLHLLLEVAILILASKHYCFAFPYGTAGHSYMRRSANENML